ncbi:hypothetical protein [Saccharospirillum alexandrii]|uniref:hypothetical protein n=1 Tax=Saccharospirillum alexandrii TaxID=2448477 RepID=UPI000FD6CBDF|nr:hypothetical protein [Saccharospirillum alexandrii]
MAAQHSTGDELTAEVFSRLLTEQGLTITPDDQAAALPAAQALLKQAERVCAAMRAVEADHDSPL